MPLKNLCDEENLYRIGRRFHPIVRSQLCVLCQPIRISNNPWGEFDCDSGPRIVLLSDAMKRDYNLT